MRMDGQEESSNVEDARGSSGGGGGGLSFGGGGIGIGTIAVALIAGWIFGINPLTLLGALSGGGSPVVQSAPGPVAKPPAGDPQAKFVSQVLRSTEVVWTDVFRQSGKTYQLPKLTLYRGSYPTGCGQGEAAMGPFYCPADAHVYLDMGFFDTMSQRLGAPGQFAQAYVIAHEVGHHVQNLLGISDKVDAARRRGSEAQANAMSVRLELQADCFAGVWAKRSNDAKGWLEAGDIESALNAASQIGDDTLQRKSRGQVVPESFTHGTSAQRVGWFKRGFESGSP
ncbi:MAG: neutral zinc metallopeptidase, partial [Burkholderiales bacterium]